jgi:hypothetical protein
MENKCLCLRSREVKEALAPDATQARLFRHRYYASDGEEWFLSFESTDRRWVYGFLKLRFNNDPYKPYLPKEILGACIVRWLQVYGRAIAVGSTTTSVDQAVLLLAALARSAANTADLASGSWRRLSASPGRKVHANSQISVELVSASTIAILAFGWRGATW